MTMTLKLLILGVRRGREAVCQGQEYKPAFKSLDVYSRMQA